MKQQKLVFAPGSNYCDVETVDSPDVCVNRHGGNPESVEANPPSEAKRLLRVQVESFIRSKGPLGATSDEIEASLNLSHQTISPRLTELKTRGYVVPGERRITRSGKYARALVHIGCNPEPEGE